jgi:hypothetical protein
MFTRIKIALGAALSLALLLTTTAVAKGNFAFIAVDGDGSRYKVRLSDTELLNDWFAFANFQARSVAAPANTPDGGYEITRYYIDRHREVAFDRLHYYPQAGLVYYDGIVNGSSEYDAKWYEANPDIRTIFESDMRTATLQEALRHALFIRRS